MKTPLGVLLEHSDRGLTVLTLSGFLRAEALDDLRTRVRHLTEDGCKTLLFDLQEAEIRGPEVREFFLEVLNDMKGRGGRVAVVAKRHDVVSYFSSVRNLIEIYPNRTRFRRSGILETIKRQGIAYSKKTGVRLSPAMALLLLLLVASWIFNLALSNSSRADRLERQREQIAEQEAERAELRAQLDELRRKLAPLRQLGLTSDSLLAAEYTSTEDWIDHLEDRERRRLKADSLRALSSAPDAPRR